MMRCVWLCLTAVCFFDMGCIEKKVVDVWYPPLLKWGFAMLSHCKSVIRVIYISKCICISIHTPWHLENLWHPFKGVHGFVKGTHRISWWTYSYNLLSMNTIIVYYLNTIYQVILHWWYWWWLMLINIILSWWASTSNLMLYAFSIYRRFRRRSYYSI